jgi:hypothetical protein
MPLIDKDLGRKRAYVIGLLGYAGGALRLSVGSVRGAG